MREVDTQSHIRLYGFDGTRGGVLVMDDTNGDNIYSLNEAILTLNLQNKTNVSLSFSALKSTTPMMSRQISVDHLRRGRDWSERRSLGAIMVTESRSAMVTGLGTRS